MEDEQFLALLYVTDPLCAWSYGFSPEISRLQKAYQGVLTFRVVLGGLHAKATQPLDEPSKDDVAHRWHQVNERTGQEFNYAFFQREDFVFNSEFPSRALVAVRHLRPDLSLKFFQALQQGFFSQNLDITKPEGLREVRQSFPLEEEAFASLLQAEAIRQETHQDFAFAARIGATVLPSVYLQTGEGQFHPIGRGYRTFEDMKPVLDRAIHLVRVK